MEMFDMHWKQWSSYACKDTWTLEPHFSYLISVKYQTELEDTAAAHCLHTWKTVYLSRRER